ncbi:MAG: protein kinase [Acidobacteria bacterium]|nr:protein kinase [Acidobacteriota bacterium]
MRDPRDRPKISDLQAAGRRLRRGQRLGKYKILRHLGEGGFASVFAAQDTIEGVKVALKIPHPSLVTPEVLDDFYREARLAARLAHPHILSLKNADFIEGRFVAVTALGEETLGERLTRRIATAKALNFAEQALSAVAFAHQEGVIHCDIKPENFILFGGDLLRLTDFGIAKVAMRTVQASGSGTLGYFAPEQAMGKPSPRSDVFALGLLIYRMLSGQLPEWPFAWPPAGYRRLRRKVGDPMTEVLAKAISLEPRRRFADAGKMLAAFRRARRRSLDRAAANGSQLRATNADPVWPEVQRREFIRHYGRALETRHACPRCHGPVSEAMTTCPWCRAGRAKHRGRTTFPAMCPRCHRGMKLDWRYCPWCYGPGFEIHGNRSYPDRRYTARCDNRSCSRKDLMPFMRYCPWCRRKVRRSWEIPGEKSACRKCRWGVLPGFWQCCPWCASSIRRS